ncbi:DoxX family protein [Nocardiopsis protaetiae]|uniref:DoxX family protein n=1 Tax=Nocardiopsis protaetiae TaxID=3382270 RepID=UPI00387AECEE
MFIATVVVSVLIAAFAAMSGVGKLRRAPAVVASMETVRFPLDRLWMLALVEFAGAAGVLVGLVWWPLGAAAATGLVVYFVCAVIAHVRVGDTRGLGAPLFPLVLSVAALALRLLTV